MSKNINFVESLAKYITWQIPKFVDLPTQQDYALNSSQFSLFGAKDMWWLQILPNGTTTNKEDIIMRICKEASSVECRLAIKMGITYVGGKDAISGEQHKTFDKWRKCWGKRLIKRSALESTIDAVAPDGTLTVFCAAVILDKLDLFPFMEAATRITVITATSFSQTPLSVTTSETALQTTSKGVTTLIDDLKDLYVSKRCADVKITVKGTEFLAHSHILISRSKVFSSMLNIDMLEKNSGVVEITDCDPISFDDFLLFIYTGNLEVVSARNATSLYETAEKYDLKDLKEECLKCMVSKLTVDSFCDVLHLAVLYNETDILVPLTNFFLENTRDILLTTKWTKFLAENTSLGNELVLKFVDKHVNK